MEYNFCLVFFIVLVVSLARNAASMPKDSTIIKDSLQNFHETSIESRKLDQSLNSEGLHIQGRVWCQHGGSDPAEDDTCQGHCIPKGYSYGLCVSNMCSCI